MDKNVADPEIQLEVFFKLYINGKYLLPKYFQKIIAILTPEKKYEDILNKIQKISNEILSVYEKNLGTISEINSQKNSLKNLSSIAISQKIAGNSKLEDLPKNLSQIKTTFKLDKYSMANIEIQTYTHKLNYDLSNSTTLNRQISLIPKLISHYQTRWTSSGYSLEKYKQPQPQT